MSTLQGQAGATGLLCSVIVPVYNGKDVIARCLDALAQQTVPPGRFEVIVVDDGSTDSTGCLVADWATRHPDTQLRFITQANAGPASARNHGARLARSPLLFFTDADCIPTPGWAAALLAAMADPHVTGAMGSYCSAQTAPAARFSQLEFEERYALMQQRPTIDLVATYSAAYRRAAFLDAGGFDDTQFALPNNEDVELAYRLSSRGRRLVFAPDAVVQHEHDATWRGYFRTKVGRGYWRTVVYRSYPGKAVRDSYTPQVLKLQVVFAPLLLAGLVGGMIGRRPTRLLWGLPLLVSTLPLARLAWKRSPGDALWAPWGVLLRALAFGVGIGQAALGVRRRAGRAQMQKEQVAP